MRARWSGGWWEETSTVGSTEAGSTHGLSNGDVVVVNTGIFSALRDLRGTVRPMNSLLYR